MNDVDMKRYAGLRLRALLLSAFASSKFYATDVSAIAYWGHHAGVPFMEDLASCPDELSFVKNASRKVSTASGLEALKSKLYWGDVPMAAEDGSRIWAPIPFAPIYEELTDEFLKSPDAIKAFAKNLDSENWRNHDLRKELQPRGCMGSAMQRHSCFLFVLSRCL